MPNEIDKWNWNNGVGTWDENAIRGHFGAQCKEEFKEYLKAYSTYMIDLSAFNDTTAPLSACSAMHADTDTFGQL